VTSLQALVLQPKHTGVKPCELLTRACFARFFWWLPEQQTLDSFYGGFPGWGWHRYWGGPVVVEAYEVGTLVVDLFDTDTKQVVWWGSASGTVLGKPEKNSKNLNKALEKMFKDFPPKSSRKTDQRIMMKAQPAAQKTLPAIAHTASSWP
jgi:hypothetical protein